MKRVFLFIALVMGMHAQASAEDTSVPLTVVGRIPWDGRYASPINLPGGLLETALVGGTAFNDTLSFQYSGTGAAQIPILTLSGSPLKTGNGTDIGSAAVNRQAPIPSGQGAPHVFGRAGTGTITTPYYMILGEVKYENVSPGSYLEMWSHFGSGSYFSRTLGDTGDMGSLGGSSDWRPFMLPFDSTGAKEPLSRIEVNLHLTGPGKVWLRNLELGQVPTPVWITALTSPKAEGVVLAGTIAPQMQSVRSQTLSETGAVPGINWKSFLLGVSATGLFLLVGGGLIFISRRWNRRRHERELRRIASLDS